MASPQRYIVIIAGGRGERFWPESRLDCPKHLLPIVGKKPMLTQTVERVRGVVPLRNVLVITSSRQEAAVRRVCSKIPKENIVIEPMGRDTAPAVALAAAIVRARDPLAVFAVLPADHVIHDTQAYQQDLKLAFEAASSSGVMVTIGIKPTEPATGFGYINRGTEWKTEGKRTLYFARRFVEKPSVDVARRYLASGDYLWNAGMFVWSARVVEEALLRHAPSLHAGLEPVRRALAKGRTLAPVLRKIYPQLERISVDYALLEKADNVVVLPATFDWDDVGAWPAVARHLPKDALDNVVRGRGVVEKGRGNIVYSGTDHLVAVIGTDDLVVVHTKDATLVCSKAHAQDIKTVIKRLEGERDGIHWL